MQKAVLPAFHVSASPTAHLPQTEPQQTTESPCTCQLYPGPLTPPDFVDPKGPEVGA